MIRYCDWCGAYVDCEKCDDPLVATLTDAIDDPTSHHIHACCDAHEEAWEHPQQVEY